jgi:hypothetical protein
MNLHARRTLNPQLERLYVYAYILGWFRNALKKNEVFKNQVLSNFLVPFGEKKISVEYFLDQIIFRTASPGVKFWLIGILRNNI